MRPSLLAPLAAVAALTLFSFTVEATDVDGPDDCARATADWGDAPEGTIAYPSGVIGAFPTCFAPGPIGTQTISCVATSSPPGPAGFVRHVQGVGGYWLGCYSIPGGFYGIDSEPDGKTNSSLTLPTPGFSVCSSILTDCVEPAYGMFFDQDECTGDGSDATLTSPIVFPLCSSIPPFAFKVYNCGPPKNIVMNILVDWNSDGDWNDNFSCAAGCAREWAVKNVGYPIGTGCTTVFPPLIVTGPFNAYAWMRITIADTSVPDDFPWNGSASMPGQTLAGGETEDYPVSVGQVTSSSSQGFGRLRMLYR
jgi:hypothetical protein